MLLMLYRKQYWTYYGIWTCGAHQLVSNKEQSVLHISMIFVPLSRWSKGWDGMIQASHGMIQGLDGMIRGSDGMIQR